MLINKTRNTVLAANVKIANTFFLRFKGLMGQDSIPDNWALVIEPCKQIHSFFVKVEFDAVFLNSDCEVVHVIPSMKPSQISPFIKPAIKVIELSSGKVSRTQTKIGDKIFFTEGGCNTWMH
jgi:uncharacterized membrane protein (UPF0127 family)